MAIARGNMKLFRSLITITAAAILFSSAVSSAQASAYGAGKYGENFYGGVNKSSGNAPGCGDQAPGTKAPWLYSAIPQDGNSVLLSFTEADDPVDKYVLVFGLSAGNYQFGQNNIGSKGMRTYLVRLLSPKTTYYFKVRGGHGCATGPWSNEISATTKGLIGTNTLDIVSSELKPVTTPAPEGEAKTKSPTTKTSGYQVKVKVTDTQKKPIVGAKVTVHSTPQTEITDKNGIANFQNVEPGEHKVTIAYANYQGEQTINLTGEVKEFDLNIVVKPVNLFLAPPVMAVIGLLVLSLAVLTFVVVRGKVLRPPV